MLAERGVLSGDRSEAADNWDNEEFGKLPFPGIALEAIDHLGGGSGPRKHLGTSIGVIPGRRSKAISRPTWGPMGGGRPSAARTYEASHSKQTWLV